MKKCQCPVCIARRFSRDVDGVCIRDPCPNRMNPLDTEASGDKGPFSWRCSTGVSHRLHLGCALDAIFRLGGCPTCRAATKLTGTKSKFESNRCFQDLPCPRTDPIVFQDFDIIDLATSAGVPPPPTCLTAPCCHTPQNCLSRQDRAPLGLRDAPQDPLYAWRPGADLLPLLNVHGAT